MMRSKIFSLYLLITLCGAEDVLESLYKSERSRATACALGRTAHACSGVVWRRHWVLARASCVLTYRSHPVYVRKGVVNCTHDLTTPATVATGEQCIREVTAYHKHPLYPEVDLMLLRLDWPYDAMELIDNCTRSDTILNKVDTWINNILLQESMVTIKPVHYRKQLKMYSTPIKMFLVTVVLPSISFIVFFLFIIFFTGTNKGSNIPYRNLNNDKKENAYV